MRKKRRPQKKQEPLWKNILLWLGVAGVLLIIPSEDAFLLAIKHEERREAYITSIVERFPPPENVANVKYASREEMREESVSATSEVDESANMGTSHLKATAGTEHPLGVFVLPRAFSGRDIQKKDDFLGTLFHEYDHAKFFKDGGFTAKARAFIALSDVEGTSLFVPVAELYALRNEIQRIGQGNSQAYREITQQRYFSLYIQFWEETDAPDPQLLSDLKVEFFPVFMLKSQGDLFTTNSLGVTNNKGERFLLSPQEVERVRALDHAR
ncbi:MAG: hypothetical protein Q7S76_00545 [bacterium]|nr:hypothetical protein [bacterium]